MEQQLHVKKTALKMVKEMGLINLSRRELCERAGIPDGSFPFIMDCNFTQFISKLKTEVDNSEIHHVNKSRTNPALRRDQILNVAITISKSVGYNKVTRELVAESAGISTGLVNNYFGTMPQLKRAIMRTAVAKEIPEIIAQGLANNDKHAMKASPELRAATGKIIANI